MSERAIVTYQGAEIEVSPAYAVEQFEAGRYRYLGAQKVGEDLVHIFMLIEQ